MYKISFIYFLFFTSISIQGMNQQIKLHLQDAIQWHDVSSTKRHLRSVTVDNFHEILADHNLVLIAEEQKNRRTRALNILVAMVSLSALYIFFGINTETTAKTDRYVTLIAGMGISLYTAILRSESIKESNEICEALQKKIQSINTLNLG